MKLKYVIFDELFPVLLTEAMGHSEVRPQMKPTSAGFCSIHPHDNTVAVWGESVSLKLKSQPTDAFLIEKMLFVYD